MQKKPLYLILVIALVLVFLFGIFVLKFIDKEKPQTENKENVSYIYDDISQVVGNIEIAKQMTGGAVTVDVTKQEVKGVGRGILMSINFAYLATLTDVTNGAAAGLVKANFENNEYNFYSSFANLTEPINGDYYEGWLVRKEPFGFVSTGKLEKIGGEYVNLYKTNMDLRDYNLYIVTMEQNDGNSAPAKHILEGVLKIE